MIEKRITLSEAARRAGVDRLTLRTWFREDGYKMPSAGHRRRTLVLESDVEDVLARRTIYRGSARRQFPSHQAAMK